MMLNHVIVGGDCEPNYIDRCALISFKSKIFIQFSFCF